MSQHAEMPDGLANQAEEIRQRVADNLSGELNAQRWSQRAAATALGLSHRYINSRATGKVEMSASDLDLFASFLKVPVARFFDEPNLNNGNVTSINSKKAKAPARTNRDLLIHWSGIQSNVYDLDTYRQARALA